MNTFNKFSQTSVNSLKHSSEFTSLYSLQQDLGISKVGHMKRILQGTKDLAKSSMVDL